MKAFITDKPLLFAIGITVLGSLVEFLAFSAGGLAGLPEPALILIALLVSVAISLGFIHWLGWWKDAGFVATVENLPALTVPFLLIFIFFPFFGTVAIEPKVALFIAVIFFLTALSEEALSRGLLVRVFLPKGKWAAALIPAVLFGLAHIVQVFQGMAWTANLLQITNAIIFWDSLRSRAIAGEQHLAADCDPYAVGYLLDHVRFVRAGGGPHPQRHSPTHVGSGLGAEHRHGGLSDPQAGDSDD